MEQEKIIEKKSDSIEQHKFDENFDIADFIDKHDLKKTTLKKNNTPKVIIIAIIAICIIIFVVLALIGMSFSNSSDSGPKLDIKGKWQQEDGTVLEITSTQLIMDSGTMNYKIVDEGEMILGSGNDSISAAYKIDDELGMLFLIIPYGDETVTLEYVRVDE
ncbi:MAG: hypothetical protein J1E39_08310 [Eubacterium sp.]|nr:hypothetical protein [Eubacterium sp.]